MALTSLVLLLTEGDIWSEISALVLKEQVNSGITLGYIVIGICLSIYHGFSKREKKPWEIEIMKWFVTATLAGVAVSSAFFIYSERNFGYIVFTIWNGIQAFVLLFMSGKDYVGEYVKLHTREASYIEVLSGVIVVFLVLYIESLYNTHWSIAFSSVLIIWSIVGSYFKVKKDNFLIKNLQ